LEVLSRINDVDLFIYTYLIKTWIMAGLSALAWAITVLSVYKAAKHNNSQELERTKRSERGRLVVCTRSARQFFFDFFLI
jgi:hypothetical protein